MDPQTIAVLTAALASMGVSARIIAGLLGFATIAGVLSHTLMPYLPPPASRSGGYAIAYTALRLISGGYRNAAPAPAAPAPAPAPAAKPWPAAIPATTEPTK